MDALLYLSVTVATFVIPLMVARLLLSILFPKLWARRFVRWGIYSALVCLTYILLDTLSFRGDVHIPQSNPSPLLPSVSYYKEQEKLYAAEGALYNLIRINHIMDCFFPWVICPSMLVSLAFYALDRSLQRSKKN